MGDRSFPWKCPSCGKREVYPTTVPYTVEIKHDGLTHTISIPAIEMPQCRSCEELLFSDAADEQINDALRSYLKLLTPLQIRRRRKVLGLNQAELAAKIGAAEETISRWESGVLIQSRTSDNLLRIYFALPSVRELLVGEGQNPDLGMEDKSLAERTPAISEKK